MALVETGAMERLDLPSFGGRKYQSILPDIFLLTLRYNYIVNDDVGNQLGSLMRDFHILRIQSQYDDLSDLKDESGNRT